MPSRPFTEVEVQQILSNTGSLLHKCLIVLGVKTGFRISELLSLTYQDLYEGGRAKDYVTVQRRNMKGKGGSRSVPLHDAGKGILNEYYAALKGIIPGSRVFPMSRFQAHRILKKAAEGAGITGKISTHSMRKTFGMNVYIRTEKNIVAAQRALGHKSLSSTSHYLSVDQEIVDSAILA